MLDTLLKEITTDHHGDGPEDAVCNAVVGFSDIGGHWVETEVEGLQEGYLHKRPAHDESQAFQLLDKLTPSSIFGDGVHPSKTETLQFGETCAKIAI